MKRFTKFALGFATFFAIIGLVFMIIAFAMGFTMGSFVEMVQDGKIHFEFDELHNNVHSSDKDHHSQECTKIDIELLAGNLVVKAANVDKIEVKQDGVPNFQSQMKGDILQVRGGKKMSLNNKFGSITIFLPKEYVFDEIDLEIGAGKATFEEICAQTMDIEVGAGQVEMKELHVQFFNASTGAGQIAAEFVGRECDYNFDIECGIGEIIIGDEFYSGLAKDTIIRNPNAENEMDIECGIGQVEISFQE